MRGAAGTTGPATSAPQGTPPTASAQTPAAPPPPTFRVDTDLVVVDLVATDKQGRFLGDLRPDEIQVLESGQPRQVQFLQHVRAGRPSERTPAAGTLGAAPTAPAPATGTVASPAEAPAVAALVDAGALAIVIDLQSTPQEAMPRVIDAIGSMVGGQIPEGTQLMLATVWRGLEVRQAFTTDRQRFFAALDTVKTATGYESRMLQLVDQLDDIAQFTDSDPGKAISLATTMGSNVIMETHRELADLSQALAALARMVSPLPGRKHVVVYSMGYAIRPVQSVIDLITDAFMPASRPDELRTRLASSLSALETNDSVREVERLVDQANRSQVSFYTIDPMGLQPDSLDTRNRGSVRLSTRGVVPSVRRATILQPQEYLRTVALDTGGRVYVNTNDLEMGLRRAWVDAREYYLVGFVPSEVSKKGTEFRRIEVKVARPDVDVRYRRGYWRGTDRDRVDRDTLLASRFPDLFSNGDLDVEAIVDGGSLNVTTFLRPMALRFSERDGRFHNDISIQAFLRDGNGKLVGGKGLFSKDVALKLPPDQLEALQTSDNIEIPTKVKAPSRGTYTLVVMARHSGSRLVTKTTEVVVP
jgi:VWFA-related protein